MMVLVITFLIMTEASIQRVSCIYHTVPFD